MFTTVCLIAQECPEGVEVEFEVELVGFEKTPHWHSMTGSDKVKRSQELKEQGNRTFKAGRLDLARQKYLKALKLVDHAFDIETDEEVCRSLALVIYMG